MYLWKVDQLVDDFKNDNVSEKEKFKYVLLFGVVLTIISDPILLIGDKYTVMDTINLILMLAVVIWGTYYCYLFNQKADNRDFITRFICIGLPIAVRLLAFGLPIFIVIGVVEGIYDIGIDISESGIEAYTTTVGQIIASVLFSVAFYLYLGAKLKAIGATIVPNKANSADAENRAAD